MFYPVINNNWSEQVAVDKSIRLTVNCHQERRDYERNGITEAKCVFSGFYYKHKYLVEMLKIGMNTEVFSYMMVIHLRWG